MTMMAERSLLLDMRVETQYSSGQRCRLTRLQTRDEDFDLRIKLHVEPVRMLSLDSTVLQYNVDKTPG
jgi:hypothetical protein